MRAWPVAMFAFASAFGTASCLRSTAFNCANSSDCGAGGTCEPEKFCSFADSSCDGRRFGDSAGPFAGQCVGAISGDAGVDGPPTIIDGRPIDGPIAVGCPNGYDPLPGLPGTHRYRVLVASMWSAARDACPQTTVSAYLAIPDDLAELQALATAAGITPFWVGISDQAVENTFVTVLDAVPAILPWTAGAPDNGGPGEDCVAAISGTEINDDRCNRSYVAICECVP